MLSTNSGFVKTCHELEKRLEDEYDASVIVTPPNVSYRIKIKKHVIHKYEEMGHSFLNAKGIKDEDRCFITVNNPNDWPSQQSQIDSYYEPMVKGTVIVPQDYLTQTTSLCNNSRGIQTGVEYIDQHRIRLEFMFPLSEIITKFFDSLKRVTSGK
jgi:translation elongation factor EF-4